LAALRRGGGEAAGSDEAASGDEVDASFGAVSGGDVSRQRRVSVVTAGGHGHYLVAVVVVADAVGGGHGLEGGREVVETDPSGFRRHKTLRSPPPTLRRNKCLSLGG